MNSDRSRTWVGLRPILAALALLCPAHPAPAQQANAAAPPPIQSPAVQNSLPPDLREKIDRLCADVLVKTRVPSVSLAVVKDGKIVYLRAYGDARLDPRTPAAPGMRYEVGSISKQFTAAAILLLQEEGKLSLDDRVAKFLPSLTRAGDVTVRQLLSHTSGYQDYWPQDYLMPNMMRPTTPQAILDGWARKPLDFEPGTQWQYSNTNYVIAGLIIEKVSGRPLMQFLRERVFTPLGMGSVTDVDQERLADGDPAGYLCYALGPLRPAPKEGRGWLFGAGELVMTAEDLARWDVSVMDRTVLRPSSHREQETVVLLKDGLGTGYGLGMNLGRLTAQASPTWTRVLSHDGGTSGFTAMNVVLPDDRAAVVALTNQDGTSAADEVTRAVARLLLAPPDSAAATRLEQARQIFAGLQHGTVTRSLFTDNANSYFSARALQDFADSLGPLGTPQDFVQVSQSLRGGMTFRAYRVTFAARALQVTTFETPDGKWEQFLVAPGD